MDQPPQDPKSQPPFLPAEGQPQQGTPEGVSQPPISQPNWEQPPGQMQPNAQYYRGPAGPAAFYGSWQQLQALADGYFALNWVFLANVLLAITANFGVPLLIAGAELRGPAALLLWAAGYLFLGLGVALLSYPQNKKIAYGKGWPATNAILASVLMAFSSMLCCGIIGFIVMQQIAGTEMKKYGVRGGFFGMQRKDVNAVIQSLQRQQPPMQDRMTYQGPPG